MTTRLRKASRGAYDVFADGQLVGCVSYTWINAYGWSWLAETPLEHRRISIEVRRGDAVAAVLAHAASACKQCGTESEIHG